MLNGLLSEDVAVVGVIDPDANAAGELLTAWIPIAKYGQLMAVIMAGDLGVSATIDAKLRQAKDASGTGVKDITGKAITQLTQAGTDRSNKQAILNVRAEELDRNNGFTHVALSMTTATATSDSAAIVVGTRSRFSPVEQSASVIQTVA